MSALLKTECCDGCEQFKRIRSLDYYCPDEAVCALTGTDDFDCAAVRFAGKLADIAASFAHQLTEVDDLIVRREIAMGVADAFANGLYVRGDGAEFDAEEFLTAAGVGAGVKA